MMHTHYYRVEAKTHFELGVRLAELFRKAFYDRHGTFLKDGVFDEKILSKSQEYLKITDSFFPLYIEELKGYASGLGVDFQIFWSLYLQEDIDLSVEKCTSCFSKNGLIIGHNEDNFTHLSKQIVILEKTIKNETIFELHYYNSLGGDACSINSAGFVQTINTLHHTDHHIGVPRNIIARLMSETKDPKSDFSLIKKIARSMGYSYTFVNTKGEASNIESSATESRFTKVRLPYIHTNHYLTDLTKYEDTSSPGNSKDRYREATKLISSVQTAQDMMLLLEKVSCLSSNKERTCDTIARMVFDLRNKVIWCWLQRESPKGWIKYPINFL